MHLGPFTVRLERAQPHHHGPRRLARLVALASIASVLSLTALPSAGAVTNPSASSAGSLEVAVRSVSVTPTKFTLNCHGGGGRLLFPNDTCTTGNFTITNGAANAQIDASVSDFRPADQGTPWTPCVSVPGFAACTGPADLQHQAMGSTLPGADQFLWFGGNGYVLDTTPRGDLHLSAPTAPGTVSGDSFEMWGPQSSTDPSTKWTVTLTYWAMPTS